MESVAFVKQKFPESGGNMNHLFTFSFLLLFVCLMFRAAGAQDRQPAAAGSFYPDNLGELSATLQRFFSQTGKKILSVKPIALIAPHAGIFYSGQVAAYAYNEVKDQKYDAVIVVSPSHIEYFQYAAIYPGDSYVTPLGKMPVDKKLAALCETKNGLVKFSSVGHVAKMLERGEHALEIQLPFLQTIFGNVPIIPIVIGTMDYQVIESLGQKLGEIASKENVLLIASTDLSHYHPYNQCKAIDQKFMTQIERMNPKALYTGLYERDYEACGGAAVVAIMIAAQKVGANRVKILKYANSGDVPGGSKSQVVGYCAAVMYRNEKVKEEVRIDSSILNKGELKHDEQVWLLDLAEATVKAVVTSQSMPNLKEIPPKMKENRGAFVTLEKNHELRGCIGYILPIYPLYETVMKVAKSAALEDPRFQPVSERELKDITVEVSVLTVPEVITNPNVIEVGKHGIIIRRGYYQGLLLPQVATDYGWDRETFLGQTCLKAGLPRDAWKDKSAEIQIFSAQVFNRETVNEK